MDVRMATTKSGNGARRRARASLGALLVAALSLAQVIQVSCQLPADMQQELDRNLAEQARIQAMRDAQQRAQLEAARRQGSRAQHQQQVQAPQSNQQQQQKHDPNNYSYQHVSPPMQYSYYQPFGDAPTTAAQAPGSSTGSGSAAPLSMELASLGLEAPVAGGRPQVNARSSPPVASFTGAGGLPLAPQALVAAGQPEVAGRATPTPAPLTEADFRDITGGENYGAPAGDDFGLGDGPRASRRANNDHDEHGGSQGELGDFPSATGSGTGSGQELGQFGGSRDMFAALGAPSDFGAAHGHFGQAAAGVGRRAGRRGPALPTGDFDFASQPSSARGDQAAPSSLQGLLGANFPGLGAGGDAPLEELARSTGSRSTGSRSAGSERSADEGALDMADLGDQADGFGGADFGGLEQTRPAAGDADFGLAAAAAGENQQPVGVAYPDGSPRLVGSLFSLTQPQSMSQTRYSALPDKGTFQDYPAYASGGNHHALVRYVVAGTPPARPPAAGRYGWPSTRQLAPEYRQFAVASAATPGGARHAYFDYARLPDANEVQTARR